MIASFLLCASQTNRGVSIGNLESVVTVAREPFQAFYATGIDALMVCVSLEHSFQSRNRAVFDKNVRCLGAPYELGNSFT